MEGCAAYANGWYASIHRDISDLSRPNRGVGEKRPPRGGGSGAAKSEIWQVPFGMGYQISYWSQRLEKMPARVDKISASVAHLEAASLLVIRGDADTAAHTLIAAAKTVIWDLAANKENPVVARFDQEMESLLRTPEQQRKWRSLKNRTANFFKHADKDPDGYLEIENIKEDNDAELFITIMALFGLDIEISPRLRLGLIHCRFAVGNWFNIEETFLKSGIVDEEAFRNIETLTPLERRDLLLELFDHNAILFAH